MSQEQIFIENLTFGYDKEPILKDFSLKVCKGDFVGIIGANGVGKSTMIKLILGQLSAWQGILKINGMSPLQNIKQGGIGYVPQIASSQGQNFPATAMEVVLMGLYKEIGFMRFVKKEHRQKALDALTVVNMQDYKDRLIYKLSGGQKQRVMIAKALVSNPEMLLLDEPTTGVDSKSTEQLMRLLEHLNRVHGITIILISHDVPALKEKVKTLFELKNGQAIQLMER